MLLSINRVFQLLVPGILVIVLNLNANPALGQLRTWTNGSGGLFNSTGNWSPGSVPVSGETALFNLPGSYTVTFTSNPFNSTAVIEEGTVTFALSGNAYSVTGGQGLNIGSTAGKTARLTLQNGQVNANTTLGAVVASTGFLTMGTDTRLNGQLTVGNAGTGTLNLSGGAQISDSSIFGDNTIGTSSTGNGTVNVSGLGTLWQFKNLTVGRSGTGRLNVSSGGVVSQFSGSDPTVIGSLAGSLGEVVISGAGSQLNLTDALTVGGDGTGRLTLSSGAELNMSFIHDSVIGGGGLGNGIATLSGNGTRWTSTGDLRVGNASDGTLNMSTGSQATFRSLFVGNSTSLNSIVNLDGNNTRLTLTSLGTSVIGDGEDGQLNASNNAQLQSSGLLVIGRIASGTMNLDSGADVASGGGMIGQNAGASGSVTLSGPGTTWNSSPFGLYIGGTNTAAGGAGFLELNSGEVLNSAGETKIWNSAGSQLHLNGGTLNTVSFTRLGSLDFDDGLLHVQGGVFSNGASPLSLTVNSSLNPILRLSNGASSTNVSALTLGSNANGRLEILSGSTFSNSTANLGNSGAGQGSALVDGVGSTWTSSGNLGIGNSASGTVAVSNGATVNSARVDVGVAAGGEGDVQITNSTWNASNVFNIGNASTGTVNVNAGGVVNATSLDLGVVAAGNGTLNIAGGDWNGSSSAIIGDAGTGTVRVLAGGSGSSSSVTLGNSATGNGTLLLSGGSWSTSGNLQVGQSGVGQVFVSSGGQLNSGSSTLGVLGTGSGTIEIAGAGSVWNAGVVTVGGVSGGNVDVLSGGRISATAMNISSSGLGAVNVNGLGSRLETSGVLNVGLTGVGSLNVSGGGQIQASNMLLGQTATGTGTAVLNGAGTNLSLTNGLFVGGSTLASGGSGALTINTGTSVTVGTELKIWNAGSSLNLNGGSINTTSFTRQGTFNFTGGQLSVNGGVFTNGVSPSTLALNGATVNDLPTLLLSSSASTANIGNLTVGSNRRASLQLNSGSSLSANTTTLGSQNGGFGTVQVTGLNSNLNVTGNLSVGSAVGGQGELTIADRGRVNVSANVLLADGGRLNINNGTLALGGLGLSTNSLVNWSTGTVHFTSSTSLGDSTLVGLLGSSRTLGTGRILSNDFGATTTVSGNITVDGGRILGGGFTNSARLILNQSDVELGGTFTNSSGQLTILQGASRLAASSMINNGEIQLGSPTAQLDMVSLTNSGTILGTGSLNGSVQNNASGRIDVTTGNRLVMNQSGHSNSGTISLVGGELQVNGLITNAAQTGLISGREAIVRFNGGLANQGSLIVSNGTTDIFGDITSTSFVSAANRSRITVSGGGVANFYDDVVVNPGQTDVQASAAGLNLSSVVFFGSYNGGVLGGGTAFIEGDHRPGNSPGLVNFDGDVFYGGLSVLNMELGGLNRGLSYDSINAVGIVGLAGELNIDLIAGFQPTVGNTFVLIDNFGTDSVLGSFLGLNEGAIFSADGFSFQISYQAGSGNDVWLTAVPEPTAGILSLLVAMVYASGRGRFSGKPHVWQVKTRTN